MTDPSPRPTAPHRAPGAVPPTAPRAPLLMEGRGGGVAGRPTTTTTDGARLPGPAMADRDLDAARRACRLDASPGSTVAMCRRVRCEWRAVGCDPDDARVLHALHFRAVHVRPSTTNRSTTR